MMSDQNAYQNVNHGHFVNANIYPNAQMMPQAPYPPQQFYMINQMPPNQMFSQPIRPTYETTRPVPQMYSYVPNYPPAQPYVPVPQVQYYQQNQPYIQAQQPAPVAQPKTTRVKNVLDIRDAEGNSIVLQQGQEDGNSNVKADVGGAGNNKPTESTVLSAEGLKSQSSSAAVAAVEEPSQVVVEKVAMDIVMQHAAPVVEANNPPAPLPPVQTGIVITTNGIEADHLSSDDHHHAVGSEVDEVKDRDSHKPVVSTSNPYRYQAADLFAFRKNIVCLCRPSNLPHIPGVTLQENDLDGVELTMESMISKLKKSKHAYSGPSRGGGGYSKNQPFRQNSVYGSGRAQQEQQMVINLPTRHGFRESANTYKPQFKLSQPESESKRLSRDITNLLNKLTPENFEKIRDKFLNLKISSIEDMVLLGETLFDKATKEKAYAETFAKLCKELKEKIFVTDENDKKVFFKGAIIKCCQTLFEKELKTYLEETEAAIDAEIEDEKDPKTKALLESSKADRLKLKEDQYFGNMKFIGELIRSGVIGSRIFFHCTNQLMLVNSAALDCLCELHCTVGKLLDTEGNADVMKASFDFIAEKSQDPKIESRIRFKLQDLIELRSRNWRQREIQEKLQCVPLPLKEIREKTIREDLEKEEVLKTQARNNRGPRGSAQQFPRHVPMTTKKPLNAASLVLNTAQVSSNSYLGPSSGQSWQLGSSAGSQKPKESSDGWNRVGSSMAKGGKQASRNPSVRSDSNAATLPMGNRFLPAGGRLSGANSGRNTPTHLDSPGKGSNSSLVGACDDTPSSPQIPSIGRPQMELKVECALPEYISHNDDSQIDLQLAPVDHSLLVECVINFALEKCELTKLKAGEFLHHLHIPKPDLMEGINAVLAMADDLKMDIPEFWKYMGQIMDGLLHNQTSDLSFLHGLDKTDEAGFAVMLSTCFHRASRRLGHTMVGEAFRTSGLNWALLLPQTAISDYLKNEKLEFTVYGLNRSDSLPFDVLNSRLQKEYGQLDNEKIFDFIEGHVNSKDFESPEFLATIAVFVFSCSLHDDMYEPSQFSEKVPILKKYVSSVNASQVTLAEEAILKALEFHPSISSYNKIKVRMDVVDDLVSAHVIRQQTADEFKKKLEEMVD